MVALSAAMDARSITALKLIRTAGGLSTVCFIGSIMAVITSITLPTTMDALSAATTELQGGAFVRGRRGGSLCAAVLGPFVRAIEAVDVTVTGPQARNANRVVAPKRCTAAGGGRAGGLVAGIVTVCLIVAHEGGRHTLAVRAAEFRVCALPGRTVLLINSILTVGFSITAPVARYTLVKTVCTTELRRFTCFSRAGTRKFVCAVSTVICTIAHPSHCDTFPYSTLELVGSTCCECICLNKGAEEKQQ